MGALAAQAIGQLLRGDVIAYGRYNPNADIYILDVQHRLLMPLLDSEEVEMNPVWSPDGQQLVYSNNRNIYMVDSDGQNSRLITSVAGIISSLAWIPGSNTITFSAGDGQNHGNTYRIGVIGEEAPTQLLADYSVSNYAEWSPNGTEVVFSSSTSENVQEIFVMNIEHNQGRQLTTLNTQSGAPAWSPDGQWVAFASGESGDYRAYIVDAQGNSLRRVTSLNSSEFSPIWSSDGEHIYFITEVNGDTDIYRIHIDGSHLERLTNDSESEASLNLMP